MSCLFQLEKTLKTQIDAWEQEHDKEFLVNGQKFLEYVQQQWEHHHTEKEKEKLERVCDLFDFDNCTLWYHCYKCVVCIHDYVCVCFEIATEEN